MTDGSVAPQSGRPGPVPTAGDQPRPVPPPSSPPPVKRRTYTGAALERRKAWGRSLAPFQAETKRLIQAMDSRAK